MEQRTPLFRGSAVALVTPFTSEGKVDMPALAQLLNWHLECGTDAIVLCATTGECATLSDDEVAAVLQFAVRHLAGRIPVIAGCGRNDTEHSLRLCLLAQAAGVSGLLLVNPYYNKSTQAGIRAHYRYIADRVDLPILLYNVPSRTGIAISPETCAILSEHPRIVGIKEAGGDLSGMVRLRQLCPPDFALYSGNDDHTLAVLALGGQGVISTAANILPREMHRLCHLWQQGDRESALALQLTLQPIVDALFCETNPIPVKTALSWMGKCTGTLRLPLVPIGYAGALRLESAMHKLGLLPPDISPAADLR